MKKYAVIFLVLGFVFVSAACWAVHTQGSAPSFKQDSSLSESVGSFTVANGHRGRRNSRGRERFILDNDSENYLLAGYRGRRNSRGRRNGKVTTLSNDAGYLLAGSCRGRRNSRGRRQAFQLNNNSENYLLAQSSGRRNSRGRRGGKATTLSNDAGYLLAGYRGRRNSRGRCHPA